MADDLVVSCVCVCGSRINCVCVRVMKDKHFLLEKQSLLL